MRDIFEIITILFFTVAGVFNCYTYATTGEIDSLIHAYGLLAIASIKVYKK